MIRHKRSRARAWLTRSGAIARELWRAALEHDLAGLAAQLSYRFGLATLWLLIFFTALSGFVADAFGGPNPTQRLMQSTFSRLPADVRPVFERQLDQLVGAHSAALLVVSGVSALWTGTVGVASVMNALNRVHAVRETRTYLRRLALAAALTLSVGVLLLAVLVLLLVRQIAGHEIADALGVPAGFRRAVGSLSVAGSVILLIGATAVLYRVTPDRESSMRWVSAGTLLFVLVWLVASFLFGAYLANLPSYANAYGAIGAVLVLFTWFYVTSFTLLLGAEVDALMERGGHDA